MISRGTGFRLAALLPVVLLAILPGCVPAIYRIPDEAHRISDPDVLLGRIGERQSRIRTVSTTGRVTSESDSGNLRGRVTTMASAAGLVRLDAWTPTWDLVGSFVGDPEGFVYFVRGESSCIVGPSTPEVISKIIPMGLDYLSLLGILLGTPPIADGMAWTVGWDTRTGYWLLAGNGPAGNAMRIWADFDGVVHRALTTSASGTTNFEFSDMIESGGEMFPSRISVSMDGNDTTLVFKDIEVNGEIDDADFEQKCPDGLTNVFYPN